MSLPDKGDAYHGKGSAGKELLFRPDLGQGQGTDLLGSGMGWHCFGEVRGAW